MDAIEWAGGLLVVDELAELAALDMTDNPRSVVDGDTTTEDRVDRHPAVDPTSVVADLESFALLGLDQVEVLTTVHLAQHDVANIERVVVIDWFDGAELTRLDSARHRVTTRPKLDRLTLF